MHKSVFQHYNGKLTKDEDRLLGLAKSCKKVNMKEYKALLGSPDVRPAIWFAARESLRFNLFI